MSDEVWEENWGSGGGGGGGGDGDGEVWSLVPKKIFFLPVLLKTELPAQPRIELCFAGMCGWVEFGEDEKEILSKPFCLLFSQKRKKEINPVQIKPDFSSSRTKSLMKA